jgi:hypothetical protein
MQPPVGEKTVAKIGSFVIYIPFEYEYIQTRSQKKFDETKIHGVELIILVRLLNLFGPEIDQLANETLLNYLSTFECRNFPML